jgi:hypothetical protein
MRLLLLAPPGGGKGTQGGGLAVRFGAQQRFDPGRHARVIDDVFQHGERMLIAARRAAPPRWPRHRAPGWR